MELLDAIFNRRIIIALAIAGAIIATLGSYLMRAGSKVRPERARMILRIGYGIAWLSVAIFIVAGFRSAWSLTIPT